MLLKVLRSPLGATARLALPRLAAAPPNASPGTTVDGGTEGAPRWLEAAGGSGGTKGAGGSGSDPEVGCQICHAEKRPGWVVLRWAKWGRQSYLAVPDRSCLGFPKLENLFLPWTSEPRTVERH